MGFFLVVPLLPELFLRTYSVFSADYGCIFNNQWRYVTSSVLWSIGFCIGSPIIGYFSDVVGYKKLLVLFLSISILCYFTTYLSILWHNLYIFWIARFILGFCNSSYNIAVAYISSISTKRELARNISCVNLCMSLGMCASTLVTLFLSSITDTPITLSLLNLSIYFLIVSATMATGLVLSIFYVPQDMNYLTPYEGVSIDDKPFVAGLLKYNDFTKTVLGYFFLNISIYTLVISMPLMFESSYNHSTAYNALIFIFLGCGYVIAHFLTMLLPKILNSNIYHKCILIQIVLVLILPFSKDIALHAAIITLYAVVELISYNRIMLQINRLSVYKGKLMGFFGMIMCAASLVAACIIPVLNKYSIIAPFFLSVCCLILSSIFLINQKLR